MHSPDPVDVEQVPGVVGGGAAVGAVRQALRAGAPVTLRRPTAAAEGEGAAAAAPWVAAPPPAIAAPRSSRRLWPGRPRLSELDRRGEFMGKRWARWGQPGCLPCRCLIQLAILTTLTTLTTTQTAEWTPALPPLMMAGGGGHLRGAAGGVRPGRRGPPLGGARAPPPPGGVGGGLDRWWEGGGVVPDPPGFSGTAAPTPKGFVLRPNESSGIGIGGSGVGGLHRVQISA